ncbi:MAG: hypothetical protein RLZ35_650 [Pseudomonadota bacterium]|jgi:flagellum-specific ATP synthase
MCAWKPLEVADNHPDKEAVTDTPLEEPVKVDVKREYSVPSIDLSQLNHRLADIQKRLTLPLSGRKQGVVFESIGLLLTVKGLSTPLGELCYVALSERMLPAVVTGFKENITYLMPLASPVSVMSGCHVYPTGYPIRVPVGEALLGRVLDGLGRPLDRLGDLSVTYESLHALPINPLHRKPIAETLDVGVKAIDGLLTIGKGQRMGLFSTSGLGKSVLLGMMARHAKADVVVVSLVGERGREVRDFIEQQLGELALRHSVVIATPADDMPMMRVNGAIMAMRIADFFRRSGKHVLLLMDSLSRVADAQREVAISMGEPIGLKGYPSSVFQLLATLVEMAGSFKETAGSVTGLFTVLAQDERGTDPIVHAVRSVLDGHIVLSKAYAEQGRYPAIDLEASLSRVMTQLVDKRHRQMAMQFRRWHALYRENKDLLNMGAYVFGQDKETDLAIKKQQSMEAFLRQDQTTSVDSMQTRSLLSKITEKDADTGAKKV